MAIELFRSGSAYCEAASAATYESDDFQLIAFADQGVSELGPPEDASIHLDGDAAGVESEILEELLDRYPGRHLVRLAVEPDAEGSGGGYFFSSFLFAAR
jgi:hypothetical protein